MDRDPGAGDGARTRPRGRTRRSDCARSLALPPRSRVADAAQDVAARARPGDTVVYTPDAIGDVVDFYAHRGTRVVAMAHAPANVAPGHRLVVIGAFAFDQGRSTGRSLALAQNRSRTHPVDEQHVHKDVNTWMIE
jgi:hypothetical protein